MVWVGKVASFPIEEPSALGKKHQTKHKYKAAIYEKTVTQRCFGSAKEAKVVKFGVSEKEIAKEGEMRGCLTVKKLVYTNFENYFVAKYNICFQNSITNIEVWNGVTILVGLCV